MSRRQELYDRIRDSSRKEVILEEMVRLGFWPRDEKLPEAPPEEAARRRHLQSELAKLTRQTRELDDPEGQQRAMRRARLAESRRKQRERREERIREREARAAARAELKTRELDWLGDGVSFGLRVREFDEAKLRQRDLPVFASVAALATAMGCSVSELRFLAYDRRVSTITHYRRFSIPKKSGGLREISAPMPRLKRAQEWILSEILSRIELHPAAHGFRKGRSILTNARPHVGMDVVINADLEDFFPTISYRRVRGVFRSFGYSEQIATIFALLCCEPPAERVELDGRQYHVARGERRLPQGAPSSPALTNIICRGLDARLSHAARDFGFTYTRYADDLTFSGKDVSSRDVGAILRRLEHVVGEEGFRLHPKKTRVQRAARRQEVTGLVVNQGVSIPRETLRRFRAVLRQIELDGPAGKRWGSSGDVMSSIRGFACFVAMVHPEKGTALRTRVRQLADRYGHRPDRGPVRERWKPRLSAPADSDAGTPSVDSKTPRHKTPSYEETSHKPKKRKKPWWKFW